MKRISILSVLILLCAMAADAQLRYGFNLGGAFADASLSDAKGYSALNRSGFRGGLALEYQMPRCGVAFDASVLYSRYNSRLRDDATGDIYGFGRNYLELPLNVKYKFWLSAMNRLVAPMIITGPSFMIGLDGRNDQSPLTVKRFQPGWNVGLGVDFANILQLTAGYRFGIGNVAEVKDGAPESGLSLHTSGWHVSAILLFDF